jgi:hypothetical protein
MPVIGSSGACLHDICLAIWAVSGVLLALSHIASSELLWGLKTAPSRTPTWHRALRPAKLTRASRKTLMLVGGLVILAVIAVFLFALFNMPS